MPEWWVSLKGNKFDLEDLVKLFHRPKLRIKTENGNYYLESSDFDTMTESVDVQSHAGELIAIANGIAKVHSKNFDHVALGEVIRDKGGGTFRHFGYFYTSTRLGVDEDDKLSDGTLITPDRVSEAEALIPLSNQSDLIRDALNFFREDSTWWSLRKTYEAVTVELQPTQISKKGWATEPELTRFREWASHYVHGELGSPPDPHHGPPMSLGEAQCLIRRLLSGWLHWKVVK